MPYQRYLMTLLCSCILFACDEELDETPPDVFITIVDTDGDGIPNEEDLDDDNDGVNDEDDRFPKNPAEYRDTDGDGVGDQLDQDDDNDGVVDQRDVFPLNPDEYVDSDGDGVGDHADTDDDNDGIPDTEDDSPRDTYVEQDFDRDGLPDSTDDDDDNDGVPDAEDAFPYNPREYQDSDLDGIGDHLDLNDDNDGVNDDRDAFPLDPTESHDHDGDGVGDNADLDDDNDGIPDVDDQDPFTSSTPVDTDGDGIPNDQDDDDDNDGVEDSADAFPLNPDEYRDSDGDGMGDRLDDDDDNDGYPDVIDAYPYDPNEYRDLDGDGIGDHADLDDDGDGVLDEEDDFPHDPAESVDQDGNGVGDRRDCGASPFVDCSWRLGICRFAVPQCVGGEWRCEPEDTLPYTPLSDQLCDGIDNDCDGRIDEDIRLDDLVIGDRCFAAGACGAGTVECASLDAARCSSGIGGTQSQVAAEFCNALDDDCDGLIDEEQPQAGDSCERGDAEGVCGAGITECISGELQCVSNPLNASSEEVCDQLDNDCDGTIDEDFDVGVPCEVGVGACLRQGQRVCGEDQVATSCDVVAGQPDDELCDGIDNDCDGTIDEDIQGLGLACEVGVGACFREGVSSCMNGELICSGGEGVPREELCDGIDNDCDGDSDEGFGLGDSCAQGRGACISEGVVVCDELGASACSAVERNAEEEQCDSVDNDCDGIVDEDLGVDTQRDVNHCGGCGIVCDLPHATTLCVAGQCLIDACDEGYFDQDHNAETGCESFLPGELIYVDDDGLGPGDGSEQDPYPSLIVALENAQSGDRIFVKEGVYFGPIQISVDYVRVIGEDQEEVRLIGDGTSTAVSVSGELSELRNVTVFAQGSGGVSVSNWSTVSQVIVDDVGGIGCSNHSRIFLSQATGMGAGGDGCVVAFNEVLGTENTTQMSPYSYSSSSIDPCVRAHRSESHTAGKGAEHWNFGASGQGHLIAYNRIHGTQAGPGSEGCSSGWRYSSYVYYGTESMGRSGGRGIGAHLTGTGHTFIGNEIYDIRGGRAGDGKSSYNRSGGNTTYHPGGTGGEAVGILLDGAQHRLEGNLITNLIGGEGGDAPDSSLRKGKSGSEIGILFKSYDHYISDTNTVEGEPIIYSYGESDKVISGYDLTLPVMTTNLGKIVVINGERIRISDNQVANVGPINNGPGMYAPRHEVYAVWVESSLSVEVSNNQISNIRGGDDDAGQTTPSYALSIFDSPSTLITDNSISNLRGGSTRSSETAGYLVNLERSDNSKLYRNVFSDLLGTGVQLTASQNISFENNLMHTFVSGVALKITDGPHQTKFKSNTLDLSGTAIGVNIDQDCGIAIENSIIINAGSSAVTRYNDEGPLALEVSYSLLWNNPTHIHNGVEGEGVLYQDPQFVQEPPYSLGENSPAIDAGPESWTCEREPIQDVGQCRVNMGHLANTAQAH